MKIYNASYGLDDSYDLVFLGSFSTKKKATDCIKYVIAKRYPNKTNLKIKYYYDNIEKEWKCQVDNYTNFKISVIELDKNYYDEYEKEFQ